MSQRRNAGLYSLRHYSKENFDHADALLGSNEAATGTRVVPDEHPTLLAPPNHGLTASGTDELDGSFVWRDQLPAATALRKHVQQFVAHLNSRGLV